jgi:hypothetical protein
MKPRTVVICASLAVCGLSIAGVVLQAHQLDVLRNEGKRLQRELKDFQDEQSKQTIPSSDMKPVMSSPSSELLRLRNQVSQLTRRQRELANVQVENERLQTRIASAHTNIVRQLPPGYIRKAEARNMGYSTPEATLETMLWAIQNRDFANVLGSFSPKIADKLRQEIQRKGDSTEEFFKQAGALPGFNVIQRGAISNDVVELKVEIVPGSGEEGQPMRFRLINGEWKLDSQ